MIAFVSFRAIGDRQEEKRLVCRPQPAFFSSQCVVGNRLSLLFDLQEAP